MMFDHCIRGIQVNSALYLAGCFLAGLATQNGWAWRLALAAMGVTYLSYLIQAQEERDIYAAIVAGPTYAVYVVYASIALGVLAGFALLF
jgi:hypothetical protein